MLDPGVGAVILWAIGWLVILAIPSLGIYALFRFLRAYERRGTERTELSALRERLLRLEEGTADIGDRLDKLAEEQRFLTRLLRERPGERIDE